MRVFHHKKALRDFLTNAETRTESIGFVPTMGALHAGHLSLMERALRENQRCVVSIFVNPTQFNQAEDLAQYPRDLERDLQLMGALQGDVVVFAPEVHDMYTDGLEAEHFDFSPLDTVMEGAFRPGHFQGVGTVVKKLFDIVQPTRAYFGEKDFQQLQIIRRLVTLLEWPIEIVACPIHREPNGLAMSSRNERLTPTERAQSGLIFKALSEVKHRISYTSIPELKIWVNTVFSTSSLFRLEYFEVVDEQQLTPMQQWQAEVNSRAFIAVWAGSVRLIDNLALYE